MHTACKLVFYLLSIFYFYSNGYAQTKQKAKYNYLLYLPKNYEKQLKKYPLVIYLHGGSQRGNDLNKLKGYGLPAMVDKGKNFNFIIASPQCPDNKYWSTENWFDSLYSDLISKYRIDTNRIYLTGISMGGYGTYIAAMDFPTKFAALAPLCGGCNDSDTSKICTINKIPIWTFHGTADDKISIAETQRVVKALQKCNGHIRFTPLPGYGHDIGFLYEKNSQIYGWLLKQKK